MLRRALPALFLLAALVGIAPAVRGDDPAPAAKDSTSCTEVIDAPRAKVWAAYTTKEGLESWGVAHASVDLKLGGLMRTHYDPKGKLGDAKTIENEIIAFDPERMIALRVQRAPEGFPFPKAVKSIWHVVYFEDAGEGRTRITCKGLGYGSDAESVKMRGFFEKGNEHTLAELKAHFAKAD